jgi:hypothetical protein
MVKNDLKGLDSHVCVCMWVSLHVCGYGYTCMGLGMCTCVSYMGTCAFTDICVHTLGPRHTSECICTYMGNGSWVGHNVHTCLYVDVWVIHTWVIHM